MQEVKNIHCSLAWALAPGYNWLHQQHPGDWHRNQKLVNRRKVEDNWADAERQNRTRSTDTNTPICTAAVMHIKKMGHKIAKNSFLWFLFILYLWCQGYKNVETYSQLSW